MMFSCLLCSLFGVIVAGPVQRATWWEGKRSFLPEHDGARLRPSFLHLPIFHHAPHPLVAAELFRPLSYKRPLPAGLTALLLPPTRQPESVQETGARAVDIWCGVAQLSVRVDRFQLRAWSVPSLFRLGSCQPSKVSLRFLYFHYGLLECDGEAKVIGGQMVYSHLLTYTPPRQDYVLRAVPLNLSIHCQYNRFHYTYQVGFIPQLQHTTFMKNLKPKLSFSLTVCNAQWEPLPTGHWFFLGEQVYFVAQSSALLPGERLYVDSCYATSSSESDSTPRLEIISNLGCMTDSRREGSSSQFLLREDSVVKFSVDAFLFKAMSQTLYLHCSMAVGLATSVNSKSCNYKKVTGRWEELEAQSSVCSCCDSMCADTQHSMNSSPYTIVSPGWFIGQKGEEKRIIENISFQAEDVANWTNEEKKSDVNLGKNLNVQTFSHLVKKDEIKIPDMMSSTAKKITWRHSNAGSWSEKKEKEKLFVQNAHSPVADMESDGSVMSDQIRPQENVNKQEMEEVFRTKDDSESVSSSDNSSSNTSDVRFATSSGFYLIGLNNNVSIAANPVINPCTNGDGRCSVRGAIRPERGSTVKTSIAESFAAFFYGDANTNESQFDERLETLTQTHPVTGNLEFYPPGFSHARKLGKSRCKSNKTPFIRSEQSKPVNKPVKTKSSRMSKKAGDSFSSKIIDGDESMLHGLQIRESELEHSAHPTELRNASYVDGLLCESEFDSGIEENKALHLSQFTAAANKQRETHNFSRTIPRNCSGSASSETSPNFILELLFPPRATK
ncbi:uncharacterized protein LOC114843692 [Betta splendens]|uniref:Uncharacterized protein LOC114843692 n=1 Tax=Betta splendens TaxID=158456 RepID=A0A6P7KV74_BETSP|nr:uncharacterized protein LOC114843692 [Betta splendens]